MPARPKYTPDRVAKIVEAVELGATYKLAYQYAGISHETFAQWQRKPEFAEAIKAAEGRAAVGWLRKIEAAANEGTWQAAAWKLERRYPKEYGRNLVLPDGEGEVVPLNLVRVIQGALPAGTKPPDDTVDGEWREEG